jgi:hypothetical protein
MSKVKADSYRELLAKLEADYQKEVESREMATGNQNEVYAAVGKRALADRDYQEKRQRYLQAINDEDELSPAVAEFIKPKEAPASKFDVDSGKAKPDTSMNPLGGKQI